MKQLLTIEQSAELIKRGVSGDKASGSEKLYKPTMTQTGKVINVYTDSAPVFNLADIFTLLPKVLHKDGLAYHYVLTIYWDEDIKAWRAMYDAIGDNIAGDCAAPELIDALFALVCSLLDNHVKLD